MEPVTGDPFVYLEPAGPVCVEEKIQRSVFIAQLQLCRDEGTAQDFLSRVRAEHRDATHNCWAYLLGPLAGQRKEVSNSSDDGEPSGTAGRPILGAVRHSGMVNVMVVVTRYFGGVKLGVRGLIEAYGGAASRALASVQAVERVPSCRVTARLPWGAVRDVTHRFKLYGGGDDNLQWDYSSPDGNVSVSADVPLSKAEELARALDELKAQRIILAWEKF
ncbi:MAG: YigZ family protein [Synergistaceae bacterium]|nr:YigZ family protein [Synergistaceae bacterium]